MREVVITGIGQVPVGEHWEISLRSLAARAIQAARHEAGDPEIQGLYVGNLLAPTVSHQSNLGTLLADNTALKGIESWTVEAADASGAAALRMGYLAVASELVDTVVVIGVEKYTDMVGPKLEAAVSQMTDYDYEAMEGLTPTGQAGLLMQRYLHEYPQPPHGLGVFPVLMHANAGHNPNAMYRKPIKRETYARAELTNDPLNMFDAAPYADGAAAAILTTPEKAADFNHPLVRISGSAISIDRLALHDRPWLLGFDAVGHSLERACRLAGILPQDVDFLEISDTFSIYAALTLEAAGFAPRGKSIELTEKGEFNHDGRLPLNTMGGSKGRGHPLAATGMYQVVEAVLQLRGEAGASQVKNARRGMTITLGGPASTVVTNVLERMD